MISSIEKNKCTGCKMCGDICPCGAVDFKTENDGCWYPTVDEEKCIECGLCIKKCPALNIVPSDNNSDPAVYAAWSLNEKVRYDSTSGGIYYEVAKAFIDEGGYIAGCIFSSDFKTAKHVIGKTYDDLNAIMGSKYFQSDTAGIYKKISTLIKNGEKVLFCGTPCQVAALRSFLGKDQRNLYLLDFICKGINSPKAYTAYIDEIERNYKSSVKLVRQKSKKTGWQSLATNIIFQNGKEYHKKNWVMQIHYGCKRDNNAFMYEQLGPDTGYDCINNYAPSAQTADFLNSLIASNELPKTILYSLNPNDNAILDTIIGCFQDDSAIGKIQHGSAWWFNDHYDGMRDHLSSLAANGVLSNFIGMLTDSRSFLSYTRHEYFRRILCELIGEWVEEGKYPNDREMLSKIVTDICYNNAVKYFRFSV